MRSEKGVITNQPPIHLEPREWEIVRDILARYAPGRRAWAYGSRATGQRLKSYSDLDIALSDKPIRMIGDWTLKDALEEARIAFRCDVVVLPELDDAFALALSRTLSN